MLEEGQVPSDRWGHRRHHDTARWSWVSKVGQRLSSREKWGDRVQLAKKSTFGGRQAGSSGRIQVCRWKPGDPGRQGEDVWGAALPGGGRGLPLQGRSTTAGFSLKKESHSSSHVCRSCPGGRTRIWTASNWKTTEDTWTHSHRALEDACSFAAQLSLPVIHKINGEGERRLRLCHKSAEYSTLPGRPEVAGPV